MAYLSFSHALLILLALAVNLHSVSAIIRYIDDQEGDEITGIAPVFLGGGWGTTFSGCASCDASQLPFNGTYMENSSNKTNGTPASVSFSFKGTSIEIFIFTSDLPSDNSDPEKVQDTNLAFSLDGQAAGTFAHKSNGTANPNSFTDGLTYYVSAFKKDSLPLQNHSFLIQNIGVSHIWFDYALYDDGKPDPNPTSSTAVSGSAAGGVGTAFPVSTSTAGSNAGGTAVASPSATAGSSRKSSSSTGTIIKAAAAAAVVVILLALIGIGFYCWRKKRRQQNVYGGGPSPFGGEKPYSQSAHTSQAELGAYLTQPAPPVPSVPYIQTGYSNDRLGPAYQQQGAVSPSLSNETPSSAYPLMASPAGHNPTASSPFPGGFAVDQGGYTHAQYSPSQGPSSLHSPSPPPQSVSPQPTVTTHVAGSGYVMTPAVDSSAAAVRAKHAEREQEYARQAREQEDALLARAASRGASSQVHTSMVASTISHSVSDQASMPPEWKAEMDRLRAEMVRMQDVQRQVVYELGSAPPPVYSAEQTSNPASGRPF